MRLLTKSEVQQELAVERKMQIDEGISLARKVDHIRQTAGSEEALLEQFRSGTTAVVLEEVSDLIVQRDNLKVEVRSLEEQRDTAFDPLYTKEAEVDKKLELLAVNTEALQEKADGTEARERALDKRESALSTKEGLVGSMESSAQANLDASHDILLASKVKEQQVNDDLSRREAQVVGRELTVSSREEAIGWREKDANNKLQTAKKMLADVAMREQALTDRTETYQRNVERDGKRSTGRE